MWDRACITCSKFSEKKKCWPALTVHFPCSNALSSRAKRGTSQKLERSPELPLYDLSPSERSFVVCATQDDTRGGSAGVSSAHAIVYDGRRERKISEQKLCRRMHRPLPALPKFVQRHTSLRARARV